jgi:Bacteriophage HK97-gp10, putative tail-component
MAKRWFEINGLNELKADLANLTPQLKAQATQIVLDSAHAAAADIKGQYPIGPEGRKYKGKPIIPGGLRRGVRVVVKEVGAVAVAAQVRNSAPHAHLWEFGTEARHYFTKRGIRHDTGAMKRPPSPVFIPTMIRHRNAMYDKLAAIIEAKGLTVKRGTAA